MPLLVVSIKKFAKKYLVKCCEEGNGGVRLLILL